MASSGSRITFGQVVIGPPGSGKTTYCLAMRDFLGLLGRKVSVINLDPANESPPYSCAVDISELVTLSDVMESLSLGPNGGLLYCMDYLESNLDWLHNQLVPLRSNYLLFDCPGQVELYTHHGALKSVFESLTKNNVRLAAVHLVDSHYCSDPGKFVSVLCTTLCTMLHVELPHINILSKVDLIEQYGRLAFNLDYYTEVMDLSYLLDHLADDPFLAKFKKLNEELVSLIESYGLVSFLPLNVQDKESMHDVMKTVDKANGYCFGNEEERNLQALMSTSMGDTFHMDRVLTTQEKYIKSDVKTVEEELRDS